MQLSLAERFDADLRRLTLSGPVTKLGVAVSGGSDSMALLHLAADWCQSNGASLHAVTIDHGLRPEAAEEAQWVAEISKGLGVEHSTLTWTGWDGQGNLQSQARNARKQLITSWATTHALPFVLLGHTADDQAETVLLRLARGSGVDGLAGIPDDGVFLRPLLGVPREDLRSLLRGKSVKWIEDPSNDDNRFDRIKARKMMDHLADLGLTRDRLLQTADHMRRARTDLTQMAASVAARDIRQDACDLVFAPSLYADLTADHQTRLLAAALSWFNGGHYRPRFQALCQLAQNMQNGDAATLAGCLVRPDASGGMRITREAQATAPPKPLAGTNPTHWDHRWCLTPPAEGGVIGQTTIAALGEQGLRQCPEWRATGLSRKSLLPTPAVWRGDHLISAPLAGYSAGWDARIVTDFHIWLVSH